MSDAKADIKDAIADGVNVAVNSPSTDATSKDKPVIAKAVTDALTPIILNATNNEPWYQSRVTLGALATLLGGSYNLVLQFVNHTPPTTDSFIAQATTLAGAAFVLYGRFIAKKPLGS